MFVGLYIGFCVVLKMSYTACWQLVFIHFCLFIIYLAFFLVIVNLHQPIDEAQIYFVFLSVGKPKTVLKGGYSGWRGVSSFASLWFERWLVWACKCAYDCGLAFSHNDIFTPFLFNQFSCSLKSGIFLSSSFQKSVEWLGCFK